MTDNQVHAEKNDPWTNRIDDSAIRGLAVG
jgi:hypothetical protein